MAGTATEKKSSEHWLRVRAVLAIKAVSPRALTIREFSEIILTYKILKLLPNTVGRAYEIIQRTILASSLMKFPIVPPGGQYANCLTSPEELRLLRVHRTGEARFFTPDHYPAYERFDSEWTVSITGEGELLIDNIERVLGLVCGSTYKAIKLVAR